MKQKKLIFNFFVNRNCKKLTDSRKRANILADSRKSHHPILRPSSEDNVRIDMPQVHLTSFTFTAKSKGSELFRNYNRTPLYRHPLKGTVSRLCARSSVICFFFKTQEKCHIDSTRFPSRPHRRRRFVFYILK